MGLGDEDDNPFFQMGEDTFNSPCVPVKRVYLNVLSVHHLSLLAEQRAWAHLRDSAAVTTDYRLALHVQSAAVVTMLLMNSGREKKSGIDLITFQK